MAEPVDPLLPARLRSLQIVVQAEVRIRNAWWRALVRFLDAVRGPVLQAFRDSNGTVPPQPGLIPSSAVWDAGVAEYVIPAVRQTLMAPYRAVTDGSRFTDDEFVSRYLEDVTARMRHLPIEVYADITRIVGNGIDQGASVPDIAEAVETRLTASGSDYWPNRATVVARTEAIGATNAGAYAGAVREARESGDPAPGKVWLATSDSRTRPAHRAADGQQVPLEQPFDVGGVPLRFPGDPAASAPQTTIMCRCSVIFTVGDETIDWTARQFMEE